MTARLTVVIPTRHQADLLRRAVQSVRDHAPPDTQLVVVADGPCASRPPSLPGDVTLLQRPRPLGFCAAANAGIRAAAAPIVQLLNDDAEVTAGWAEPALAALAHPAVVAVSPLILRWPGDTIDSAGDAYDPGGFASKRGHGQRVEGQHLVSGEVQAASGCAAFYRRDAVLAVGGFAESFAAYFEDVDLACRLRRAGGRIVYVPASRVLHRGSASYGPPRGRLLERQSCNEERLFWRNTAGTPRELTRHAAVLAGKLLRRWNDGNLTPWLCGRLRAWAMQLSLGVRG
jgi:GT2 family glycosyltransferase